MIRKHVDNDVFRFDRIPPSHQRHRARGSGRASPTGGPTHRLLQSRAAVETRPCVDEHANLVRRQIIDGTTEQIGNRIDVRFVDLHERLTQPSCPICPSLLDLQC
ncbi:MAG TPA: hypothetical protein ENI85_02705 [Deltaproteobacteria bacterium]|nr:hypothetical protein [Deltaproteobacteria bacterium]